MYLMAWLVKTQISTACASMQLDQSSMSLYCLYKDAFEPWLSTEVPLEAIFIPSQRLWNGCF